MVSNSLLQRGRKFIGVSNVPILTAASDFFKKVLQGTAQKQINANKLDLVTVVFGSGVHGSLTRSSPVKFSRFFLFFLFLLSANTVLFQ